MPITIAPLNQELRVVRISTDPKEISHLAALGLVKDAIVTVLSSQGGSVVILVKGSRLALDRHTASKIFVA